MAFTQCLAVSFIIAGALHTVSAAIGGKVPKDFDVGFVATIWSGYQEMCGGVLVNRRWVLTTAGCGSLPDLMVVLGVKDEATDWYRANAIAVDSVEIAQYYNGSFLDNLALLRLSKPAKVGQRFINVADGVADRYTLDAIKEKHRRCFIYAKGVTLNEDDGKEMYEMSFTLRGISARFSRCKNGYEFLRDYPFDEQLSCIKTNERDEASCADPGYPMVCRQQGEWYVTGLLGLLDGRDGCRVGNIASFDLALHAGWIDYVIST